MTHACISRAHVISHAHKTMFRVSNSFMSQEYNFEIVYAGAVYSK